MTLYSARTASAAMAVLLGSVLVPCLSPAQNSNQTDTVSLTDVFVPGPQTPAPPYPPDLLSQPKSQLPVIPMPQDRAADSYRIYSLLMPVGELANPGWPRTLWLLSDTTLTLVPSDQSCLPRDVDGVNMNPHVAIQPPPDRVQDFNELLDDFDRRCHERIQLTADAFTVVVPLRLLTWSEQEEFIRSRYDPGADHAADLLTAQYHGAPGLSRFSQVYFNAHHTLAMVYSSGWCGGLCAQSYWQVLGLQDGEWKRLPWASAEVMS